MDIIKGIVEKRPEKGGELITTYVSIARQGDGSLLFLDSSDGELLLQIAPDSVIKLISKLVEEWGDQFPVIQDFKHRVNQAEAEVTKLEKLNQVLSSLLELNKCSIPFDLYFVD
jgi:hypothetical protein